MATEKKSFGEFLIQLGVLTPEQMKKAAQEQRQGGERLEQTLIRKGYAKEEVILQCLADYFNLPYVDLDTYLIDDQIVKMIPEELARRHTLIPLFKIGSTLTIAMDNPLNILALDEGRNRVKTDVEIAISTEKKIKKAIEQSYGVGATMLESTLRQITGQNTTEPSRETAYYRKTYDLQIKEACSGPIEGAPAARMFDLVVMQAIRDRASDIHFEPDEKSLRVRFRIDGFLFESLTLPKAAHPAITARIKILAEMDITETRLPQDGNFNIRMENRGFEIRVSTFPTIYGENVVLRILDQTSPHITIEDPGEYRLSLIRQTQVNPKAGITFGTGLRSILRQDPDVIMVGEIRDLDTSQVAIQAALTGHLVLSTLHTNDAPEAITRLLDIGVEPYLISSSAIGILAQRLVRAICPHCKTPSPVDEITLKELGEAIPKSKEPPTFYRGKGCKQCKQSGYLGRTGIYELLTVNEKIN